MPGDSLDPSQSTQADGYVTEIAYTAGYCRELNPSLLTFALNRLGMNPMQPGAPFTYLELGSGYTLSTLIHAAGHPEGQFIAVDVLPEHITTARSIAESAGLNNLRLIEGSFAGLSGMDLPKCDFIAMHGVWSWISAKNRDHILRCVDACLKPGGVLFLSYNVLPGCSSVLPLRELMVAQLATTSGGLPERIANVIDFIDTVKDIKGGFIANNPVARLRFKDLKKRSRNYLAHEYFNADWTTFYHEDIVASLRPLGLTFATLAPIFETLEDLNYSADASALLSRTPDPTQRETVKDFLVNRQFRMDLFVRDGIAAGDAETLINATRFAAVSQPNDVDRLKRNTPLAEVTIPIVPATAILTALSQKPSTMVELAKDPMLQGSSIQKLTRIVNMLVGTGAIEVAIDPKSHDARAGHVRRLNGALRAKNRSGKWADINASFITGGGLSVSREDQMFFLAAAGHDPIAAAARLLKEPAETVGPRYQAFIAQRLEMLARRGVD